MASNNDDNELLSLLRITGQCSTLCRRRRHRRQLQRDEDDDDDDEKLGGTGDAYAAARDDADAQKLSASIFATQAHNLRVGARAPVRTMVNDTIDFYYPISFKFEKSNMISRRMWRRRKKNVDDANTDRVPSTTHSFIFEEVGEAVIEGDRRGRSSFSVKSSTQFNNPVFCLTNAATTQERSIRKKTFFSAVSNFSNCRRNNFIYLLISSLFALFFSSVFLSPILLSPQHHHQCVSATSAMPTHSRSVANYLRRLHGLPPQQAQTTNDVVQTLPAVSSPLNVPWSTHRSFSPPVFSPSSARSVETDNINNNIDVDDNDNDSTDYHHVDEELEELATELNHFQDDHQRQQSASGSAPSSPVSGRPQVLLYNRCSNRYVHVLGKRVKATGVRASPYARFTLIPVLSPTANNMRGQAFSSSGFRSRNSESLPIIKTQELLAPNLAVVTTITANDTAVSNSGKAANSTAGFSTKISTIIYDEVDEMTARLKQKLAALHREKSQQQTTTSTTTTPTPLVDRFPHRAKYSLQSGTDNSGEAATVDEQRFASAIQNYFPWTSNLNAHTTNTFRVAASPQTDNFNAASFPSLSPNKWSAAAFQPFSSENHVQYRRKRSLMYANVFPPSSPEMPQQEQPQLASVVRKPTPTLSQKPAATRKHFIYRNNRRFRASSPSAPRTPVHFEKNLQAERPRLILPTSASSGNINTRQQYQYAMPAATAFDQTPQQQQSLSARTLSENVEDRVQRNLVAESDGTSVPIRRAVAIYNDRTGLYVCLNKNDKPIARRKFKSNRCLFEQVDSHYGLYTKFRAATSSSDNLDNENLHDEELYLGFATNGRAEKATTLAQRPRNYKKSMVTNSAGANVELFSSPSSLSQCFDFVIEPFPS